MSCQLDSLMGPGQHGACGDEFVAPPRRHQEPGPGLRHLPPAGPAGLGAEPRAADQFLGGGGGRGMEVDTEEEAQPPEVQLGAGGQTLGRDSRIQLIISRAQTASGSQVGRSLLSFGFENISHFLIISLVYLSRSLFCPETAPAPA